MKAVNGELKLLNAENEELMKIKCMTYFDGIEESEDLDGVFFYHPKYVGLEFDDINKLKNSFGNDEVKESNLLILIEKIKEDSDLKKKLFENSEVKYYI